MSKDDVLKDLREVRRKCGGLSASERLAVLEKYRDTIKALPELEAQVLSAYYIDGKTHGEVAAEIYYSTDTVRRILKRGIAMLAAKIK